MDAQTSLICVGFIVLSGAALLIMSMLGMKEKTYEEAIAEQRKMPDDALLFRRPNKPKSKEKKSQRSGKKVKEKKKEVKQSESEEFDEPIPPQPEPVHVKINSEPEVLGETSKPETQKKKKKEKVKPILVHKEEQLFDEPFPPALANHFDLIQPKDDLSLRKLSRGDVQLADDAPAPVEAEKPREEPKVEKAQVEPKVEKARVEPKVEKNRAEGVKVDAPVSSGSTPVDNSPVQQSKSKDKKKGKKQESNMGLATPVTLQQLRSLILKAELSPYERQILTDLLLNEYQDDHSEWSEDMQMSKLKKQLAEKEAALANEMASSQAFQSKLKELRNELNEEKSKCRQYEEGMMSKLNDVQTLQARILQQTHERQNMVKEMQALQAKMNEDKMVIRSLQESSQAQVALQQEILNYRQQISQMDVHMTRLSEAESNLKSQLHSLSTTYATEQQKNRVLEEDLRDALGKLDAVKESNASRQELVRKLEEMERDKKKLEEDFAYEKKRHATEVKAILADADKEALYQQNRLQGEIHNLTNKISALQSEADKHKGIADKLKTDADRQKMEREKLGEDVKNLQNECERLQTELTAATSERTAGDGRENGGKDLNTDFINHEMESKNKDAVLEKLRLDLESSGKVIEKLKSELNSAQMKLNTELKLGEERFKTELNALKEEIEALKTKNNDLRQKNYKAMDALSSTEKALEKKVLETDALVNNQNLGRLETETACTALLTRLLPEVKVDKKDFKDWLVAFEASAQAVLATLRSAPDSGKVAELERQVTQLEGMVAHYKTIIEETEGMLNRLQSHVEAEESRWRESLDLKQNEIDALKTDLASLTGKVNEKEAVVEALRLEISPLAKTVEENEGKLRDLAIEKDALKSQLASEQDRLKEVNKELVKVKSNLKIGHDAFAAEQKLRLEIEEKLKAITLKGEGNGEVQLLPSETVYVELSTNSVQEAEIPKKKKKKKKNGGDHGN